METGKSATDPTETNPSPLTLRPVGVVRNRIKKPFLVAGPEGLGLREDLGKAQEEEKGREAAFALIGLDVEDILLTQWVGCDLPGYAPIVDSVICPVCGEQLMSTKAAQNGECKACSSGEYFQVEGQGIVRRKA